jgi:hypothetical protein
MRLQVVDDVRPAAMAAADLGLGDRKKALVLADESVAVGRQRGTRISEFSALLTRIHVLRETQGVEATRAIEAELAEAERTAFGTQGTSVRQLRGPTACEVFGVSCRKARSRK